MCRDGNHTKSTGHQTGSNIPDSSIRHSVLQVVTGIYLPLKHMSGWGGWSYVPGAIEVPCHESLGRPAEGRSRVLLRVVFIR